MSSGGLFAERRVFGELYDATFVQLERKDLGTLSLEFRLQSQPGPLLIRHEEIYR